MTTAGLDYSFAHPKPAAIRAAGYTFVCRYLSRNPDKNLTEAERDQLVNAGLAIVLNWEAGAGAAMSGHAQGVADARQAQAQATALGMGNQPIYFSTDVDPRPFTDTQWSQVEAYYQGAASVIGLSRTGAYGGYALIRRLFDRRFVHWGWQTYAWSDHLWDGREQIRQVLNDIMVGGAECDRDEATVDDFGQWGHGDEMTKDEHDMLAAIHAAVFLGGSSMGPAVPAGDRGPDSVTGNALVDLVQHSRKVLDGLGTIGGWTDADRALVQKLTDAVTALNSRMASA